VGDVSWSAELLAPDTTELDLQLVLTEHSGDGAPGAALVYNADLLPAESVHRMADHYVRLLGSALDSPDDRLHLLDMLGPSDLDALLYEPDVIPDLRPVHQVLEQQAALRPDAIALVRGDREVTYGELNRRANQFAHMLQERGVRLETVVAMCMERSIEWLVSAAAIFKAGGVAVLFDPRAPARRHELTLSVNPPLLVLTLGRLGLELPLGADRTILVDRIWPELDRYDGDNLDVPVDLDNLAYLIQTSGSTGLPKSVGARHRTLAHLAAQMVAVNNVTPDVRSTWMAPPGASVAHAELWPFLLGGATILLVEPETLGSPPALRDWLVEQRVTHTFVITALADLLFTLEWPTPPGMLRVMTIGGEKSRQWPPAELPFEAVVSYGTAEAAYLAHGLQPWERRLTSRTATTEDRLLPPPIGRPLPGVHAYVADPDLNLLPPGAVGELVVDTPSMTRGYLGDPALTALKFRPNPFPDAAPGQRVYCTGDLARWRGDHLLDHLGRVDTQVKIRGFRVEISEIEAVLLQHPGLSAAAVVPVPDPQGQIKLVAYVVARGSVTTAELRSLVDERLPDYMAPAAYMPMSSLPLNFGNKVDRHALPAPDWDDVQGRPAYRAPRNATEETLAAIWSEMLGVVHPGIDDNFFDLGGDSLAASRLIVRVRERLGYELGVRDVFLAPTPAALAERIHQGQSPARARALPRITSSRRRPAP
jgi:amino acid adenylation domain-containing protein